MAQPPIANDSQGLTGPETVGTAFPVSTRTSRVAWLLEVMQDSGDHGDPEVRPLHLNKLVRGRFGVCASTATADIAEANRRVQEAIDELAPHLGGQVKTALTRIALKAERASQYDVASSTWARLGKIGGLEEKSEPSKAGALTEEQLRAAIASHTERRAVEMSDAEFNALVEKRRAAKDGA